jgi:NagD protein
MESLRSKKGFLCDMDGVIYKGNQLLPGVREFVEWLYRENKQFLFLTNGSGKTPRELQQKLARMGLEVAENHFYTSALATAKFLSHQSPGCSAYVIGEPASLRAARRPTYVNDVDPDYVVIGETINYNYS